MSKEFPIRTADFIRRYISSLEQLEILLLLSGTPDRLWTVELIYDQIRSNPQSIRSRLDQLVGQGLIQVKSEGAPTYYYQPATPELAADIQELSSAYKEHRVAVIERIFAEPPSPIQGFADSFRIRKNDHNG